MPLQVQEKRQYVSRVLAGVSVTGHNCHRGDYGDTYVWGQDLFSSEDRDQYEDSREGQELSRQNHGNGEAKSELFLWPRD